MTYNILLLLDNKIDERQLDRVKREVGAIYKTNTGVTVKFYEEWRDFTKYPKEVYWGEFEGVQKAYIRTVTNEIYKRYQEEIDNVVFFIHRDNWNLKGVWGWNLAGVFNSYSVQQCRFDSRNVVNAIGTLYHELMHDVDSFLYINSNVVVEPLVGVSDWDSVCVHGEHPDWDYIRYNENQRALKAVPFKAAIQARRSIWDKKKSLYLRVIQLAQQVLVLQRQLIDQTKGDLPIKPKNLCH